MPPLTPQRKRLTNEEKLKIIEESKKPGFCRKKTMEKYGISRSGLSVILLKQKEFLRTMDSCPISPKSKSIKTENSVQTRITDSFPVKQIILK